MADLPAFLHHGFHASVELDGAEPLAMRGIVLGLWQADDDGTQPLVVDLVVDRQWERWALRRGDGHDWVGAGADLAGRGVRVAAWRTDVETVKDPVGPPHDERDGWFRGLEGSGRS